MPPFKYEPLNQDADAPSKQPGRNEKNNCIRQRPLKWLQIAFPLCVALNIIQAWFLYHQIPTFASYFPSDIAGMRWNASTPILLETPWNNPNQTLEDESWRRPDFEPGMGVIAVSQSWAESKGLPEAQKWPWDQSKGIYTINAMHSLHCIRSIRSSTFEYRNNEAQSRPWKHIKHCFDVLRSGIMCNADDTLRYTGQLHDQAHAIPPHSGIGQHRVCRDWGQLVNWANAHSACYKPISPTGEEIPEIENYKFCPDGSRPWEQFGSNDGEE